MFLAEVADKPRGRLHFDTWVQIACVLPTWNSCQASTQLLGFSNLLFMLAVRNFFETCCLWPQRTSGSFAPAMLTILSCSQASVILLIGLVQMVTNCR